MSLRGSRNSVAAVAISVFAGLAASASAAPPPKPNQVAKTAAAAAASGLTAAEVRSQIVGHSVALSDGGMTWFFNPDGSYDADDGRNGRSGKFVVQPDGKLCWTETTGIKGCFIYYRKAGKLMVRRSDPGHNTELGAVVVGKL